MTLIGIRQSSIKFGPADTPSSRGIGDVTTLAMAVRTAADLGASVINISSVACAESTFDDRALGAALSYAVDVKDAVVVAAAGNVGGAGQCPAQNTDSRPAVIASPAWYDDYVLAVGSVNDAGAPSPFSLNGPWVDVAAPGEGVVSSIGPARALSTACRGSPDRPHLGHQLCGTRRQRAGGTGAVPLPANVRAPGHDTDREHRTQAGRRVGPGGRQRRGRSVGRGR